MDNFEKLGVPERGRAAKSFVRPIGASSPTAPNLEIGGNSEGEGGHFNNVPHGHVAVLANTIDEIREQWRRRQAWHRAEKSLTLQAKALCRRLAEGGDKKIADVIYGAALGKGTHPTAEVALAAMLPLIEGRDGIERHRKAVERRLTKLAKELPVGPWVESVRGVGLLSLAAIVGEAGDLACYPNPAKLWKRMGLAVMPDGGRQRKVGGVEALDHGYNPARRSVMWNLGACIIKAGGPLKAAYDARKVYEAGRVETKAHAHNRAQRYLEKRFLRDLWSQWRKVSGSS
jgi:transposase